MHLGWKFSEMVHEVLGHFPEGGSYSLGFERGKGPLFLGFKTFLLTKIFLGGSCFINYPPVYINAVKGQQALGRERERERDNSENFILTSLVKPRCNENKIHCKTKLGKTCRIKTMNFIQALEMSITITCWHKQTFLISFSSEVSST